MCIRDRYQRRVHGLVGVVFSAVHSTLVETRQSLVSSFTAAFNIPKDSHKQVVSRYLNPLFQEFCLSVFDFTDDYYQKICAKLKNADNIDDAWAESEDLKSFIKSLHRLYLHMALSEPEIELDISRVGREYKEYVKGVYHCLDGFPKDGAACVVIVPSPAREGRVYQGIRSSVVIVKNPPKEAFEFIKTENQPLTKDAKEVTVKEKEEEEKEAEVEKKVECEREAKTTIYESVKLATTRPTSIKCGLIKTKGTHGGNKRNNSLQIKESIRNTSEEPRQDLVGTGQEETATQRSKSNVRQASPQRTALACVNAARFSNPAESDREIQRNSELIKEREDSKGRGWNFPRSSEARPISQDSDNKKVKELNRRLNQVERRCKLQKSIRESLRQSDVRQSSPKRETVSYKSINTKNDEIKKSLVKLVSFGKLEANKNHNMPLQPVKLLAQQEKLISYQQALKEKMSSLKASSINGCKFAKKENAAKQSEAKPNYSTIKTLFHASIQEINARIHKYNKAIALNEIGQYKQTEGSRESALNKRLLDKSDAKTKGDCSWRLGLFNKENKE
eukprot:TRINITY_DN3053_c0_g1_i1.p1 TRINITY_DN3053_c0_g1~~TRINITY_DN3053_c0_g1_i1.p1  ORF type:complete len:562 (+),score=155.23 TRINITY_DN3053_c0_g1_i1:76-1761(+)